MINFLRPRIVIFTLHLIFLPISLVRAEKNQTSTLLAESFDSVEHKNHQLDLYLDLIRYNTHEKIGILPYILQNKQGTYLEIGTGGDPIAELLSHIPSDSKVTIIASDIEEKILQALPIRHPELKKFLDATHFPQLKLKQLDATNMSDFSDNSLSGINASAIVHEILSYAGGFDGIKKFFRESYRTLTPGGVLVYRDPEGVHNKNKTIIATLKNKNIRLFTHIFLYKFLDKKVSHLAKSGKKVNLYSTDNIEFTIFKKNEPTPSKLTYDEYLQIPSYDIDFSRKYILKISYGLYRELARHYLTYLHQCNPLVFVGHTPTITGNYKIHYLAHSTSTIFTNFLSQNCYQIEHAMISTDQKCVLDKEIEKKENVLELGVPIHFTSPLTGCKLRNLLQKHNFEPCTHIISLSNQDCLLDYRIFGLLYDDIKQIIFDEYNNLINKEDEEHAKWLKREGEEYYCYLSDDELITHVLDITLSQSDFSPSNNNPLVLCPLSKDHNMFINRLCYTELLSRAIELHDEFGYKMDVVDGKRIIHFSKMPLNDAILIYKEIIEQDPIKYSILDKYITSLEEKNLSKE